MTARGAQNHQARRREAVHERILSAAIEHFERKGIDETRVDDICARAEVAQKTFFNHFPSRQDLVREIAARLLGQLVAGIEAVRAETPSTGRRIALLFRWAADVADATTGKRRGLVVEIVRHLYGDPGRERLDDALQALFAGLLREGVRAGEVTRAHSVATLASVVSGSFLSLMLEWASVEDFPIRERARRMARFLTDALAP